MHLQRINPCGRPLVGLVLAVALTCLLPGNLMAATPGSPGSGTPVGAFAFADSQSGITFPKTLGGLTYEGRKSFDRPGFGYSVRYVGAGDTVADVFVYDERQEKIPDGIVSPLIQERLEALSGSIAEMAQRGNYTDVKLIAKGVASDTGTVPFAWMRHQYLKSGRTWITHTLLTAFHDHFCKVRLTYLGDSKAADGFVAGLAALLNASRTNPYKKQPVPPPEEPSASEVKNRVVALCDQLEAEPFAEGAKEVRAALVKYFDEAPDISINVSVDVFGKLDGGERELTPILIGQHVFAMGRFLIQNPDRAQDAIAVQTAGLEGALRSYESMKRKRPGLVLAAFEKLLELRAQGKLAAQVKDALAKRR